MGRKSLYAKAELMLMEYLGMHHMRYSIERKQILQLVVASKSRFTAADLLEWVDPLFITRSTVYNTLDVLEKAHIVHCLHAQHSGRLMEYEFALGEQSSVQIVCNKCGRVTEVSDKSIDTAIKIKTYPNFIMQHYAVYVFGECKTCKKLTSKH